ncbi:hypothetical protein HUU05_07455 [candidate division KSB1 bacterium]|nr:hypothetical protein [candidate division KSB1 bacterium]
MINFKQEQLINEFMEAITEKFPEVELIEVTESPEDPADLWLNVTSPKEIDRKIALREFAAEKSTDILSDYGYLFLVMPRNNLAV